jgi:hypothetical protein
MTHNACGFASHIPPTFHTVASCQAFDIHYDTTEVIVLQLAGEKRWSFFEPLIRLPRHQDTKLRRELLPTAKARPMQNLTMRPGYFLSLFPITPPPPPPPHTHTHFDFWLRTCSRTLQHVMQSYMRMCTYHTCEYTCKRAHMYAHKFITTHLHTDTQRCRDTPGISHVARCILLATKEPIPMPDRPRPTQRPTRLLLTRRRTSPSG